MQIQRNGTSKSKNLKHYFFEKWQILQGSIHLHKK